MGPAALNLFISASPVWPAELQSHDMKILHTRSGPKIPNRDNLGSRAPRGSPRSQAQVLIVIVLVGDPSLHHGVINTIGRSGFRIVVATRSHLWTLYEYGIQANQSIFVSPTLHRCSATVIVSRSRTPMATSVILRLNLD